MSLPRTAVFQIPDCTKAVAVPDVDETYGWWQYFPCALRRSHPGDCEPMAKDMPRIKELIEKYEASK